MTERSGDGGRQEAGGSSSSSPGSAPALSRQPSTGGTSSPKRVSFALQPPPLDSRAGGTSPARRRLRLLPQQGPALSLITAADHSLVFIPEVDSPRRKALMPLASPFRRAPSNQALCTSDSEIAATVDMSDLPPGVHTPRGTDSLARALLSLLPGQPAANNSPEASAHAPGEQAAAAGGAAQHGRQAPRAGGSSAATPPPTPRSGAPSPTPAAAAAAPSGLGPRLLCLLGRLLEAAGTSGSSIAELAAAGSGTLAPSGCSGSSVDASHASLAGAGSSAPLFGSACSAVGGEE